mmetsp:Transcript_37585/g.112669  ORF Transcript_37585/g.112669 Transcript_37585/m.112669 type:complete len:249 (+) Transcript_37585:1825-2571(+)
MLAGSLAGPTAFPFFFSSQAGGSRTPPSTSSIDATSGISIEADRDAVASMDFMLGTDLRLLRRVGIAEGTGEGKMAALSVTSPPLARLALPSLSLSGASAVLVLEASCEGIISPTKTPEVWSFRLARKGVEAPLAVIPRELAALEVLDGEVDSLEADDLVRRRTGNVGKIPEVSSPPPENLVVRRIGVNSNKQSPAASADRVERREEDVAAGLISSLSFIPSFASADASNAPSDTSRLMGFFFVVGLC